MVLEPIVFLIHGLMYPGGMQNLSAYLKDNGIKNVRLESDSQLPSIIAVRALEQQAKGHPIVLIGHSHGGFNVMKVVKMITEKKGKVDLAVTVASGGAGRRLPDNIGTNPRIVPASVRTFYNFFSHDDWLGTDSDFNDNIAKPESEEGPQPEIVNHYYQDYDNVGHLDIIQCDGNNIRPAVRESFCEQMVKRIESLRIKK